MAKKNQPLEPKQTTTTVLSKYLDPKNDTAFKRLFGQERNKDILIELLNSVLKSKVHKPIVAVKFLTPVQNPEVVAKKQSTVDVLCRDQDGCQYIIEMQMNFEKDFKERAQYYAAKAFVSQMNKGGKYQDLKQVIFIAFTNYSIFPKKENHKSHHIIVDQETKEHDLDKFRFTFVDLVKFDKQRPKDLSKLSLEDKFCYFLRYAPEVKPEELEALIGKDKVIKRAFTELDRFYWTEEELIRYEQEEKQEQDYRSIMSGAVEKGRKEGEKKRNMEIAKQMLADGKSIEETKKYTGLSAQWLDRLKNDSLWQTNQ